MNIARNRTSLRGLRTFCVAARHLSFRLASEELFVTASAVSRQVKSLEEELGLPLFVRRHRSLELTDTGQALFAAVDPLVGRLDEVTANFRTRQSRHALRISVQPFFASEQLVPRLAEFTAAHPDIDIHVDTTNEDPETHPSSADVSIRIFRRAPEGLASDAFAPLRLVPACTPELRDRIAPHGVAALEPFPMIAHSVRRSEWKFWSESAQLVLPPPVNIIQFDSTVAVVRATVQGLGVGLVPVPIAANLFESGQLVKLHPHEVDMPDRYYFVSTHAKARTKPVRALRSWVLNTFASLA